MVDPVLDGRAPVAAAGAVADAGAIAAGAVARRPVWRAGFVDGCGGHRWSLALMYSSLPSNNISRIDKNFKKRHTWARDACLEPRCCSDAVAGAGAAAEAGTVAAGADRHRRGGWVVGGGVH
jgi:hypothetical protein